MNILRPKDGLGISVPKDLPKKQVRKSLLRDISKMEKLTKWVGFSFADPVDKKSTRLWRYVLIVYITTVLLLFMASTLIHRMDLMDNLQRYTYFGDVTALQPGNNFATHIIMWCWLFSASSILLFFDLAPSGNEWLNRVQFHLDMFYLILESSTLDDLRLVRNMIKLSMDKIQKRMIILLSFTVFLISLGGITFQVEGLSNHWDQLDHILVFGWSVNFVVCCSITTVVIITSIAQFTLSAAFIECCFALIEKLLQNISDNALISLKFAKKGHLCVVNMTLEANRFWSSYLFFFYLLKIPLQVFLVYQMIYSPLEVMARTTVALWSVGSLILLLVLTYRASRVASVSKDCFHPLYSVSANSPYPEVQFQAAVFMQGLRGSSAAFSGGEFFTINYTILSSILTAVLTYFTIISGNSSSASIQLGLNSSY